MGFIEPEPNLGPTFIGAAQRKQQQIKKPNVFQTIFWFLRIFGKQTAENQLKTKKQKQYFVKKKLLRNQYLFI